MFSWSAVTCWWDQCSLGNRREERSKWTRNKLGQTVPFLLSFLVGGCLVCALSYLCVVSPGCRYRLPREGCEWRGMPWFQEFNQERAHWTMALGHQLPPHLTLTCCTSSVSGKQRHGCVRVQMCGCAYMLVGHCWGLGTRTWVTHTLPGGEQQLSPVCLRFDLFTNQCLFFCRLHSTAQIYQPTFSWVVLPKLESICTLLAYFILVLTLTFPICEHLWNLILLSVMVLFKNLCIFPQILLVMCARENNLEHVWWLGHFFHNSETFWMPSSSQHLMV